jgi:hypothetical protein
VYRIRRTSTICVTITAATAALILLTSATLTTSVYAAKHHHGHSSIENGYETYGLTGPPLTDQVNSPPVSDQTNGNGNGNNPVGNQVNSPPVSDQTNGNGNGNNPVGKDQIQTHAPPISYKSTSSNDMLMRFANVTQPLCGAGICSQSYTNH